MSSGVLETLETLGGNTRSPQSLVLTKENDQKEILETKKRIVPGKCWCFTAWDEEGQKLKSQIVDIPNILYIMGNEICPETNRKHIQGYIEFDSKQRPVEFFKTKTTHWEKSKGGRDANLKYCSKAGDYITNFKMRRPVIDDMDGKILHPWQENILEIIKTPCGSGDRKVHTYVDAIGGCGKSTFCRHLAIKKDALLVSGTEKDVKFAVTEWLKTKDLDIILWDIPRAYGCRIDFGVVEDLKNGIMFSGKYESGMCVFNKPHVFIFTNKWPDVSGLSADKWVINRLSESVKEDDEM